MAASSSTAPDNVEYDIPPQLFDFTEYLGDFSGEIAGGAFGAVYQAGLGDKGKKFLAVKVPRRYTFKTQQDFIKNFNFEVNSWARVGYHRYVLRLFGIAYTNKCSASPLPCFLSEWQDNGELREYAKDTKDMCLLTMLIQVLEGVKHIHAQDVIHGDLRGGNILVNKDGTPRIADFGLSKIDGRDSSKSLPKGTLRWMAKELLSCYGSANVTESSGPILVEKRSKASDVWSLGMTFLELVTSKDPFFNITFDHWVVLCINEGNLPMYPGPFRDEWREFDNDLLTICHHCWIHEPRKRPSIDTLITQLHVLKSGGRINLARQSSTIGTNSGTLSVWNRLTPELAPRRRSVSHIPASTRPSTPPEIISQQSLKSERGVSSQPRSRASTSTNGSEYIVTYSQSSEQASAESASVADSDDTCHDDDRVVFHDLPLPPSPDMMRNPGISCKTTLLNLVAKKNLKYKFRSKETGSRSVQWESILTIDGKVRGRARQNSKKDAEEEASRQALAALGSLDVGIQSSLPRYTNAFKKFLEDNKLLSRVRWYSKEEGEAHNPTWKFIVERDGQYFAEGEGLTKKEAEDAATRAAARLWLSQSASR